MIGWILSFILGLFGYAKKKKAEDRIAEVERKNLGLRSTNARLRKEKELEKIRENKKEEWEKLNDKKEKYKHLRDH